MSVWFASDPHLGHDKGARFRGYDHTGEHDWDVVQSFAKVMTKRDVLYVLGDVAFNQKCMGLLAEIKGKMILVRGNHDEFPDAEYRKYFSEIHGFLKYKKFWLSHCPIHPQEMYRTRGNIHGHIHKGASTPELPLPYFNVNWDFWRRPVGLDEIRKVFDDAGILEPVKEVE